MITKFPFHSSLGGVEHHTFNVVENLSRVGCQFFLLTSCPVMISEFKKRGWQYKSWWFGKPPVNKPGKIMFLFTWPFLMISAIIALFHFKYKYQINRLYCLTLGEKLIMTPFAKLLGYKTYWAEYLSVDPFIIKNPYRFLYRLWSRYAKVLCVSQYIADDLKKIGIKNTVVIYHGINVNYYQKQQDMFQVMAKRRFSFERKNTFRLGCVSRLEKQRGLDYLIKAVAFLKKEIENIDLIIVGEGSERQNLQWLINQLDLRKEVKLIGYKENLVDWISDFDVFVLPSVRESLGVIILEALACQKPVIATRVGGIPEIIQHKENGVLINPRSPREIVQTVYFLKNHPEYARKLIFNGCKTVQEKFTLEKMIEQFKNEFLT